jgi:hypothetical protein
VDEVEDHGLDLELHERLGAQVRGHEVAEQVGELEDGRWRRW